MERRVRVRLAAPVLIEPPRPRPEEPEFPFRASMVYQGVRLDIEQVPGDVRSGVDPGGTPWSVTLPVYYGEVRGTTGADGDALDVIVLDDPDPFAPFVYVIQAKLPGDRQFDETKSVLGARTRDEALAAFRAMYDKPGFYQGCTRWSIGSWSEALKHPDVTRGRMDSPMPDLRKAMIDLNEFAELVRPGWPPAEFGVGTLPSAFAITDPVVVSTYGGEIAGNVRAVTFSSGKVRYSIQTPGPEPTTLYNVDSLFVKPWNVEVRFDHDPFDLADGAAKLSPIELANYLAGYPVADTVTVTR